MSTTAYGPELFLDSSLETGADPWLFLGDAEITDVYGAFDGTKALYLFGRRDAFAGNRSSTAERIFTSGLIPTETYELAFVYNGDNRGNTELHVDYDAGGGFGVLDSITTPPAAGWNARVLTVVPTSATYLGLRFFVPIPPTNGSGYWLVDVLSLRRRTLQYYPPENGRGLQGDTWWQDDIMGSMHQRRSIVRDHYSNLRDGLDVDGLGRSEYPGPPLYERPKKADL